MALNMMSSDEYMMDTSVSPSSGLVSKAAQACISCRKQKRKCDKTLPMCSLCSRVGRQCDYTETPAPPTADDLAVLQARLADLENRLSAANSNSNSNTNGTSPGAGAGAGNSYSPAVTTGTMGMEPSPASTGSIFAPPSSSSSDPNPQSSQSFWNPSPQFITRPNNFPSAIFLDIDCFKWAGMHIPHPNIDIPPEVYAILSHNGPTTIQESITTYFETIHPWWPIISKKRMSIGTSLLEGGPDLAMLFLAMKLLTSGASSSLTISGFSASGNLPAYEDPLYIASKRFLGLLERGGCLSLAHLQAMILVALYEIGHGIYPAAWMSVSQCARYIDIIGIPSFKESSVVLGSITTWTEMEERRRCWWAVYVLDRFICLGNKKRFCMPGFESHFVLPVDDAAWDAGDPGRSLALGVRDTPILAGGTGTRLGPFGRLVQGAVLIGGILDHCRGRIESFRAGDRGENERGREESMKKVQELLRDLEDYVAVTSEELAQTMNNNSESGTGSGYGYGFFARLTPRCLATSAQILLFDAYACPENLCDGPSPIGSDSFPPKSTAELNMQITAVEGLRSSSLAMRDLSVEILEMVMLPSEQRKISPLCLDALYCAVASLHWLFKEGGETEIGTALGDVRNCLGRLGMRWRVGGVYADLMGFHDVTTVMALRNGFS